jgi:hypothetical protein
MDLVVQPVLVVFFMHHLRDQMVVETMNQNFHCGKTNFGLPTKFEAAENNIGKI